LNDFQTLINSKKPVLVDFYADWCDPCKWLIPILDEVETKINGKGNILKINIEGNLILKTTYHIQSVPTLIIFKNANVLWRMNGFKTANELISIIEQFY
jgi:thioredoxin 1